jgi:hypothetical protein
MMKQQNSFNFMLLNLVAEIIWQLFHRIRNQRPNFAFLDTYHDFCIKKKKLGPVANFEAKREGNAFKKTKKLFMNYIFHFRFSPIKLLNRSLLTACSVSALCEITVAALPLAYRFLSKTQRELKRDTG